MENMNATQLVEALKSLSAEDRAALLKASGLVPSGAGLSSQAQTVFTHAQKGDELAVKFSDGKAACFVVMARDAKRGRGSEGITVTLQHMESGESTVLNSREHASTIVAAKFLARVAGTSG